MNKETFWKIIDEVNASVDGNDKETVLKKTVEKLMEYEPCEINAWENILDFYHDLANREHLWAALAAIGEQYTDAEFDHFRAWLISKGHDVYVNALQDPDSLAALDIPKNSTEFEAFWYVAEYAYDRRKVYDKFGEDGVKDEFEKWMTQKGKKMEDNYGQFPDPEYSLEFYLDKWFHQEISLKHGLDKEYHLDKPDQDTMEEILEEIKLGEDISSDWTVEQLHEIVPKLYEKYKPVMQMQ